MNTTSGATEAKQILVGIDGSKNSERAFEVALSMTMRREWRLLLVAAYFVPYEVYTNYRYGPATTLESYRQAFLDEAEGAVSNLAERARDADVEVTTRVVEGDAAGILIEESRTASLAVVGKRGRNPFAGRFLGSVSGSLAAHSHCPTLVVPERWAGAESGALLAPEQERPEGAASEPTQLVAESQPGTEPRRFDNVADEMNFDREIVAGIDIDHEASTVAFQAANMAELLDQPLTLVAAIPLSTSFYLYPVPAQVDSELSRIRDLYTEGLEQVAQEVATEFKGLRVRWRFFDGSATGVLSEATRTAGLVVVGTRGRGGFTGLLLGSVSQTLLNRTVAPLLVVPTKKRT